ncbi:hypothetical protein ZWY2020_021379 [Hordeum vulgare]|nr:hypothetical protein ZWY2020_021379 [Hordeum vulgare]
MTGKTVGLVVGRDDEIDCVISILCRKTKNCAPRLVGPSAAREAAPSVVMRAFLARSLALGQVVDSVVLRSFVMRMASGEGGLSDKGHAALKCGHFGGDNRAGIRRTLHRISAIRNRQGDIVGLTCRVGRAVPGSANLLQDLVKAGGSLLLIGPPGVGKTTVIREIARMLADDYDKRVMIVDTSNEIAGDGDIPHPGIGNGHRLQVPIQEMQHKELTEAVENHMPQAIVIDEIGTKLEAMAASTIAQRGIQLVASAHGVTIENLAMNPLVDMLVEGIQFKFRNGARAIHASAICIMDARKQIERAMERFKDPR